MLLQEEYIQRHSIDVPLIVCTNFGNVIFRHDDFRYLVAHLEWKYYSWHVGNFKIDIYNPVYNGYTEGRLLNSYDDITIEWDNYQSFFRNWIPLWHGKIQPVTRHESLIACWEIFLYCFDGWLARNATTEFMKLIDETSDFSNPNRVRYIKEAHKYLRLNHEAVAKKFESVILSFSTHYMDWISNLLKNNIEKSKLSC